MHSIVVLFSRICAGARAQCAGSVASGLCHDRSWDRVRPPHNLPPGGPHRRQDVVRIGRSAHSLPQAGERRTIRQGAHPTAHFLTGKSTIDIVLHKKTQAFLTTSYNCLQAFEVEVEGGVSDLVAIRDELMVATKDGKILRYSWEVRLHEWQEVGI